MNYRAWHSRYSCGFPLYFVRCNPQLVQLLLLLLTNHLLLLPLPSPFPPPPHPIPCCSIQCTSLPFLSLTSYTSFCSSFSSFSSSSSSSSSSPSIPYYIVLRFPQLFLLLLFSSSLFFTNPHIPQHLWFFLHLFVPPRHLIQF